MQTNCVVGTRHWLGPDWHHVDADRTPLVDQEGIQHPVDTICDAASIPLPSQSFQHVFSSECIEHFSWRIVPDVVKEWARLVAPGGQLTIETPDFLAACQQVLGTDTLEMDLAIQQIIFAEHTTPWDYHKTGLTHRTLPLFVEQAGLTVMVVQRGFECGWLRVIGQR